MTSMQSSNPALDGLPGEVVPKNVPMFAELGNTGVRRVSGYIEEEFLPALRGRKGVQVYREMADNSAIAAAFIFAVTNLLSQIEWRVEPASTKAEHRKDAERVEQNMDDMSHSWADLIGEALSCIVYGWSWHEICYKRRLGPWYTNEANGNLHRSKYNDGQIGWAKMPIRAQETLLRWVFAPNGDIKAMIQCPPPAYQTVIVPKSKSLLFRTTIAKNNPEGRSLLRPMYRPWYMLKRLEEHEAVGVERDLTGVPVGKVPAEYFKAVPGSDQAKMLDAFKKMVTSVRRNEQEGLLIPTKYDPDTKMPEFDFQLLTSGGSRQFNTDGIIQRYETRMLMSVLADFIMTGHEDNGGSYALHTDKSGMFRTALNSIAQGIAEVFNRDAIPPLFSLNGEKPDELPRLVPNDVDPPDLTQLASFMTSMATAGMSWFPDPELEKFLRDAARLPQLDEQVEEVRETQQRQQMLIDLAQQKMQGLQLQQQSEQSQMQTEQQRMGLQQQAIGLQQQTDPAQQQAPGEDKPDPQAEHKDKQGAVATDRAKVGLATDKIRMQQEHAKLLQLKRRPGSDKPATKQEGKKNAA